MDLQEEPVTAGRPRGHRTGMERFLIGLTAVLLVSSVALVASLVYVVTSGSEEEVAAEETKVVTGNRSQGGQASPRTMGQITVPEQFQGELCVTPGCVTVASRLLRYRDASVSPCDDFFQHACGGWQRRAAQLGLAKPDTDYNVNIDQPQGVIDWKLTQLLSSPKHETVHGFQKAKKFFNFCKERLPASKYELDMAADHILQHVLGGFRSSASWSADPVELTELLVQLHKLQGEPLFSLHQAVDPGDHSRTVVIVSLPEFDPLEDAAERRHSVRRADRRPPWQPRHLRRLLRRRRRVESAAAVPSEPTEEGGTAAPNRGTSAEPLPSTNFFSLIEKAVDSGHIDESIEFFRIYIANRNKSEFYDDSMISKWYDIQQFLYNFSKIMPTHSEQANIEINSQLQCRYSMKVDELRIDFPTVNWTRLLTAVVSPEITGSDMVCLPFPKYMVDLDLMLTLFSPRVVHNALLLMYRKSQLESLVTALSSASESDQQSAQYCLGLVQALFPVPVAGMFVRDVGRDKVEALKVKVSDLLSEVRDELVRSVEKRNAQTPSPVYKMALDKLRRLRTMVCASDSFWNDQFINDHTPSLSRRLWAQEPSPDRHRLLRLIKTITAVGKTVAKQYLGSDYQAEDTMWGFIIQPYSANAFYLPDHNTVVIPLGFLFEPYMYEDVPQYITLAALGTTVAHELLHSVGVTGFYFDDVGELWELSEPVEQQLAELRHCVRHQFTRNSSRVVEINGLHFSTRPNAELTLDENLSDHDGLALAWRTYHRWQHRRAPERSLPGVQMSVKQTFLLTLAQTYCAKVSPLSYVTSSEVDSHLPNPERVNAMLRHWPGFAAAFNCPVGSPMRPADQCSPLWLPL